MNNQAKSNLRKLLAHYDHLYYDRSKSAIPDALYDRLKDMLGKEYDHVPGGTTGKRIKHWAPVLSLGKVNTADGLRDALDKLGPCVAEHKLDGLTVVLYPDGRAVTRGDGEYGDDVTDNFHAIMPLPAPIPPFPVRFEVHMLHSAFSTLQSKDPEYVNIRNVASGILKSKDGKYCSFLTRTAIDADIPGATVSEKRAILEELGYQVVERIPADFDYIYNFDRKRLQYDIDGIVIKSDRPDAVEAFGSTGHHPNYAVAYKFPSEGCWTTLDDVLWQVGRTGRVTPVGCIEPINLLGSEISRATLHNKAIIEELGVTKGCGVLVIKANDVIPAIVDTGNPPGNDSPDWEGEPVEIPAMCPACKQPLSAVNELLYCTNSSCPDLLTAQLVHMGRREALDIDGMSFGIARRMVDAGLIKRPKDMLNLTREQIRSLPGFAEVSTENLYAALQKAKAVPLNRFLYAAGVPEVGRTLCRELARFHGTYEEFMMDAKNKFVRTALLAGVGGTIVKIMTDYLDVWEELAEVVKPLPYFREAIPVPKNKHTFVITGTFGTPRAEIEDNIRSAGHTVSGSVSKKTSYVVCGAEPGSKLEKAQSLGIRVVGLERLKEILEEEKADGGPAGE